MKYRAILVEKTSEYPIHDSKVGTDYIKGKVQTTGNNMVSMVDWAEKVLEGRKAPARVLIYETKEILVNSVFANGLPMNASRQES